jgi:hypothetical protein
MTYPALKVGQIWMSKNKQYRAYIEAVHPEGGFIGKICEADSGELVLINKVIHEDSIYGGLRGFPEGTWATNFCYLIYDPSWA